MYWRGFHFVINISMRFNEFREASTPLSEMIVRHKSENPTWVVAYEDSIWLLDEDDVDDYGNDSEDALKLMLSIMQGINDPEIKSVGDIASRNIAGDEFINNIREYRPDVFVAMYRPEDNELNLDMHGETAGPHPKTSLLVKKVVKALDIQVINGQSISGYQGNERETSYWPHELEGKMPTHGYHGTTMGNLTKIMKTGIMPQSSGNWEDLGIHTPNTVFFAVDDTISEFHAERGSHYAGDIPVIIHFKIPDINKIIPDYDVANSLYGQGVDISNFTGAKPDVMKNNHWKEIIRSKKRPEKLFGQFGVFGYRGRIPANHIIDFSTTLEPFDGDDEYAYPEYYSTSKEQMIEYLKIYEEFGYEIMNSNIAGYSYDDVMAELSDDEDYEE